MKETLPVKGPADNKGAVRGLFSPWGPSTQYDHPHQGKWEMIGSVRGPNSGMLSRSESLIDQIEESVQVSGVAVPRRKWGPRCTQQLWLGDFFSTSIPSHPFFLFFRADKSRVPPHGISILCKSKGAWCGSHVREGQVIGFNFNWRPSNQSASQGYYCMRENANVVREHSQPMIGLYLADDVQGRRQKVKIKKSKDPKIQHTHRQPPRTESMGSECNLTIYQHNESNELDFGFSTA